MDDPCKSLAERAEEIAACWREFLDALEAYIKGESEYMPGEWIDYDKPVYPPYVPVGSFRPLVIHQLHIYPSGFL